MAVLFLLSLQGLTWAIRVSGWTGMVCNTAGPFGIAIVPETWYLIVGSILVFFGVLWWRRGDSATSLPWLLFMAAGGSNLLERLHSGCVADYLRLPFLPVFNVADVVLSASVVFLLGREMWRKE